jgi:hypothetical protein
MNPHVRHSSLNEDLYNMRSGRISLIVLDLGGPSSFGVDAFDAGSFCIDVWVVAHQTGSWAYKGSAVVVEVPVCVGNESPEVVDVADMVVDGFQFQKDWGDGVGEMDKIFVGVLFIKGDEERLGCCKD